jgi:pimeloyl-ACP methyl ester carboxylesterase
LFDLLTPEEESLDAIAGDYRFDIPFLARRLYDTTEWTATQDATRGLPVGYFGASTGAAAAIVAAAMGGSRVAALVSRGGRPDLAGKHLSRVAAPTLLIVGEQDPTVVALNEKAQRQLTAPSALRVIPGATHLFEEPGALEQVSSLATEWFVRHLVHGDRTEHVRAREG